MTHEQIQSREIAEAYVCGRLSESEREAFEEHWFACEECFQQVQALQRFVPAVTDAAHSALLPEPRPLHETHWWYRPAFFVACAASAFLMFYVSWVTLVQQPRLSAEADRERQRADADHHRLTSLEKELAETKLALARPPAGPTNLPLVMLEASRADSSAAVTLARDASQLALWVEPPPASGSPRYRLDLLTPAGQLLESAGGLMRNSYGALAISVPAANLSPGAYRARLYLEGRPQLLGEYRFTVQRQ